MWCGEVQCSAIVWSHAVARVAVVQLFSNVVQPLVDSCVDEGKNGLVFAYGTGGWCSRQSEDNGGLSTTHASCLSCALVLVTLPSGCCATQA